MNMLKLLLNLAIFVVYSAFSSAISGPDLHAQTYSHIEKNQEDNINTAEFLNLKELDITTSYLDNNLCTKFNKYGELEKVYRPRIVVVNKNPTHASEANHHYHINTDEETTFNAKKSANQTYVLFPYESSIIDKINQTYVLFPCESSIIDKIKYLKLDEYCHVFEAVKEGDEYVEIVDNEDNNELTSKKSKYILIPENYAEKCLIKNIILHYTVSRTFEKTLSAFYSTGVSSHFVIDVDGKIYMTVPDKNVAFHAGVSYWDQVQHLNQRSIGIEIVNLGYLEKNKAYSDEERKRAVKISGDERYWFPFPEEQLKSTYKLIASLQKYYDVADKDIVTHSDIAYTRKSDAGPMFNYEILYKTYSAGFFPECIEFNIDILSQLTREHYLTLLYIFGYEKIKGQEGALIKTFKMHFYPRNKDGYPINILPDLDITTKLCILNLTIGYGRTYQKSSHPVDKKYIKKLIEFIRCNKLTFLEEYLKTDG